MYLRKLRYSFYFPMYSLPTSCELMFTKMLAITHLLLGFVSMNENIISSRIDDCSDGPSSPNSFSVKAYCLETFSKNSNPNSSISPSLFLRSITIGFTKSTNFSPQVSLLLKWIKVDRQSLWSWAFSRFETTSAKRSVLRKRSLDCSDLVY